MPPRTEPRTAALVLAAGASRRLGRPKQLLPYRGGVLLDAVVDTARGSGTAQVLIAVGGSGEQVLGAVDTTGCTVVENPDYGSGCSSSIAAAIPALDPGTEVLILLLGDQPGVTPGTVRRLLEGRGDAPLAVCRYDDGAGHPFAFASTIFPALSALQGDKAVWKLLEQRAADVVEVTVPGPVPLDVDTDDDYRRLLAGQGGAG